MATEIIKNICTQTQTDFTSLAVSVPADDIIFVKKFNWSYLDALKFQEACVDYVYQNPKISILVVTNHPACLTLGRGLQKKVGDTTELVEFSEWQRKQIKIPLYDIKRGGGITFHHPGQLVIYPIVNLTNKKIKVYTLMSHLLRELSGSLANIFGKQDFDYCRDLLGLWVGSNKIASIGLQVRRFVTFHGVALNVIADDETNEALKVVYPCGLPGATYSDLSRLYQRELSRESINKIITDFERRAGNLFVEESCTLN